MNTTENSEVMLGIFSAIEQRDFQRLLDLCQPDVEFLWPPSLPYAGGERGAWAQTWMPLQPTAAEQRMDPRVVAASEDEVVILWRQRGVTQAGDRFDGPVLGLYRLREGKLARAQMFYFDTPRLVDFLTKAERRTRAGATP
ncbi:MAG TPA: nuclear transport factor 2 family protein [Methylomirabilota bacterium]|nr:nuclear transport factor 2 family protein [Methylomirabilota bacterium]